MIARLDLHRPEGAADGWKDDAFDKFDVSKSGEINPREFNFAMGQTLFAYRAEGNTEMTALECFKEVIAGTQKAQTAAKEKIAAVASGTKDEYVIDDQRKALAQQAEVEALHARTAQDEWNESTCALFTVAVFPCYLCCSGIGVSVLNSDRKIQGLTGAVNYITSLKDTNPEYRWTIQNYHYETRTRTVTDSNGNTRTETYTERVNTHFAATSGTMKAEDESSFYVPNMRKRNVALSAALDLCHSSEFAPAYCTRRDMFYAANTTDAHQDKHESFSLPGMLTAVRIEWADDGEDDPWYANATCCVMSFLTCTSSCWFYKMRDFIAANKFVFKKRTLCFL